MKLNQQMSYALRLPGNLFFDIKMMMILISMEMCDGANLGYYLVHYLRILPENFEEARACKKSMKGRFYGEKKNLNYQVSLGKY